MERREPDQPITGTNGLTIGDFWAWAYSDVLSNRNRSIFAEFIVGAALGGIDRPRIEWDGVDLRYSGKTIEVKSAAYLQSWSQQDLSRIRFDIAPKRAWDAATNSSLKVGSRVADCYVFCLFTATESERADVLDLNQWRFYVVSTPKLEAALGEQKSCGLKSVEALVTPVNYRDLKSRVDHAVLPLATATGV